MAGPWRIIVIMINFASEGIAQALARNARFQRWVHLTNHRLFGTPLPREEEYYQQFLKNQKAEEAQITNRRDEKNETQRESLGNIMLDETKQVLADILPGGKRLFGKNNNSDNNNKNKKDGEKSS